MSDGSDPRHLPADIAEGLKLLKVEAEQVVAAPSPGGDDGMNADKHRAARLLAQIDTLAEMKAMLNSAPALDPRWEWINVATYGGGPEYVKGACRHLTPVEVRSAVDGELLAHLCPDCDAQLPA